MSSSIVRSIALAAWALAIAGAPAVTAAARLCNAPCLQTARAERRTCEAQAGASFLEGIDGCLERDHTCVNACRSQRQECREDTGADAELLGCVDQTQQAKDQCRSKFATGSKKLESCIDQAQLAGFQCRKAVRQTFRRQLRECRRAFDPCARACGPGVPPLGSRACKAEERQTLEASRAECNTTFLATSRACVNRDGACIQDCAATRQACNAPTQATLDAARAACRTQEAAAIAACQAAGGSGLQQCITTAQSDAFTCRDTAVDAATPGFAACTQQHLGCVAACPPA
jgi:hypothetical protein